MTEGKNDEPWSKRNKKDNIKSLRANIIILERENKDRRLREIETNNRINNKEKTFVIEQLKPRLLAKNAEIKNPESRILHKRKKWLFEIDQKKIYQGLNSDVNSNNETSNTGVSRCFLPDTWKVGKGT